MTKPKIFIGSSMEGLTVAYAVQQNLTHSAEITVWDQGVFELSQTTIESLVAVLEKSDFAIFVFSPDDITKIRKKEFLTVRDNVIFELGLFVGKLGRHRSFIIMPDKPTFHIPTDLLGITAGKYDTSRTDGSFQAATGSVCHQIRTQMKKLGALQSTTNALAAESEPNEKKENKKVNGNNWWGYYFEEKYDKAIEEVEKEIEQTEDLVRKHELTFWKLYFEYKIDPKKAKKSLLEKLEKESNKVETYKGVTRIFLWEDELEQAIRIIEEGLSRFPDEETLLLRKVEYLSKIGKNDQAISILIASNYEESEDISIKLSELYEDLETKNYEEAFSVIKKCYLKNPTSKALTFKLARLSQESSKDNLALYLFDKLTKKHSDNYEYWGYLGNSCVALGLTNKAMVAYEKADELSGHKQSWILSNIGNLLNNQGFQSNARKYFNKSLEMDPNSEYNFERITEIIKSEGEENEKYSAHLKEGLSTILE